MLHVLLCIYYIFMCILYVLKFALHFYFHINRFFIYVITLLFSLYEQNCYNKKVLIIIKISYYNKNILMIRISYVI